MIIVLFIGSLLYFFWFITLGFSFSTELSDVIKKMLLGQTKELEEWIEANL